MIGVGDRVLVIDRGDEHYRRHGTVTLGEHVGALTGRKMVEVRIDGQTERHEIGYYVGQIDVLQPVAA